MTNKCYSLNDEDFVYSDLAELLHDLDASGDLRTGVEYFEAECYKEPASYFFSIEDVFDGMRDRALDHAGEYADGWLDSVPKEKLDELESVISKWLDENVDVDFYKVGKSTRKHVSMEDVIDVNGVYK
jgi:hypothetical protein